MPLLSEAVLVVVVGGSYYHSCWLMYLLVKDEVVVVVIAGDYALHGWIKLLSLLPEVILVRSRRLPSRLCLAPFLLGAPLVGGDNWRNNLDGYL